MPGLQKNTSLQFLDLGYNTLHDLGVELLAEWLRSRPNLLGLNIAGNAMRDSSAVALGMSMPFSKIRFLDISYNEIKDEGMIFLLNSIKKPYMLRYLYFWGNRFGPKTNKVSYTKKNKHNQFWSQKDINPIKERF